MIPDADPLLILSLVIVGGLLAGRLARALGVAGVTGQILLGVGLGHSGLSLFDASDVASLVPVTDFALGLIAVTVGGHLNLRRMGGARQRLGLMLLADATITPLVVYVAVVGGLGADWRTGMLLASLAVSTAPATVVALIGETRAKGVFTKTLLGAVALNNIACILLFEVAHMATRVGLASDGAELAGLDYVTLPLIELASAAALGGLVGMALVAGTRHVVRNDRLSTASLVSVLLTAGLAAFFDVSSLLACLFLGVTLANLTPDKDEIVESAFVNLRSAIFAIFFTLAGMHLDLGMLAAGGGLVAVAFGSRILGKVLAANLALRAAGATERVRRYLGVALVPQAGVAVGLVLLVTNDPVMAPVASQLLAVTLAVVTLNELLGPLLVKVALERTGEAGKDRDRILEFLHEENIVVGLEADTKEQAIEQLVDVLIRTNHLDSDRERLLESVLERERQMSTCFGEGLAVPHGIHESGERIVGAMGISRTGLSFETPDRKLVHCMVVLATPESERERHLQVLAALAQAIGTDPNRQRMLFTAASPAHAYEILHAENAQEFNWYVDEEPAGAS
jgi:mannitol/fructose-specific phosphotransferase system IIA component (Ntr-type)/Kef-type K+ transport system membrane component KefB